MMCRVLFLFCAVLANDTVSFVAAKSFGARAVRDNVSVGRDELANGSFTDADAIERSEESLTSDSRATESGRHGKHREESSGGEESCPYENRELCLIFSLAKIARVQVAHLDGGSTNRNLKSNTHRVPSEDANVYEKWRQREDRGERVASSENFVRGLAKSTNVHCRAIQDVYIAEVRRNLPAYTCKLGDDTFVLSSERFLQDRRLYLNIRIDGNSLKNIRFAPKVARSNEYNAIPAILILNATSNNYSIEMHESVSNERDGSTGVE